MIFYVSLFSVAEALKHGSKTTHLWLPILTFMTEKDLHKQNETGQSAWPINWHPNAVTATRSSLL
jgi:hypothetical protein